MYQTICIIGVGLLGGSLGLKLKSLYPKAHIIGLGSSESSLENAQHNGCIDSYTTDYSIVVNAELIIIATPVQAIPQVAQKIKDYLSTQIIIDVGSTKLKVIDEVESVLGEYPYFIACHPIAGKESSGSDVAEAELFQGKKLIICPTEYNHHETLNKVCELWQACGAIVEQMSADEHDSIFSLTSHVPHLVAFAYINMMSTCEQSYQYTGGGLKDFARIAASNPKMWSDIVIDNNQHIQDDLSLVIAELERVQEMLSRGDAQDLEKYFVLANTNYTKIQ